MKSAAALPLDDLRRRLVMTRWRLACANGAPAWYYEHLEWKSGQLRDEIRTHKDSTMAQSFGRCDCGQPADVVIEITMGSIGVSGPDDARHLTIAPKKTHSYEQSLCASCLAVEYDMLGELVIVDGRPDVLAQYRKEPYVTIQGEGEMDDQQITDIVEQSVTTPKGDEIKEMNPMQAARLMDAVRRRKGLDSVAAVADEFEVSRYIADQRLALIELPEEVQDWVEAGEMTLTEAHEWLRSDDEDAAGGAAHNSASKPAEAGDPVEEHNSSEAAVPAKDAGKGNEWVTVKTIIENFESGDEMACWACGWTGKHSELGEDAGIAYCPYCGEDEGLNSIEDVRAMLEVEPTELKPAAAKPEKPAEPVEPVSTSMLGISTDQVQARVNELVTPQITEVHFAVGDVRLVVCPLDDTLYVHDHSDQAIELPAGITAGLVEALETAERFLDQVRE